MNICWLNEHILMWNGGTRYILEVARRLNSSNFQVDIIAGNASIENAELFSNNNLLITEFATVDMSKVKYWLLYPYYLINHSLWLKKLLKEYNVIVSSSPTTHILAMLANIKPIIICFELNPWLYNLEYIKGLSKLKQVLVRIGKPFISPIEKKSFRNAKVIICHSKFVQSEIRNTYGIGSTVIPVGVDAEKFRKVELDNNSNIYNTYNKFNVILHIASYLSPMKGTKYAIEAMKWIVNKIPDTLLLIITQDTKEAQDKLLKKYAYSIGKSYDFSKHIKFITDATDNDMVDYYSLAKVHLQPSLDENAHYPAIEAGCAECPTVGFNGKFECEDIVNNSTGFVVERYNSKDLAAATVAILANPSLQSYLGKNARQFMINKFSWDKYMEKLNAIVNE